MKSWEMNLLQNKSKVFWKQKIKVCIIKTKIPQKYSFCFRQCINLLDHFTLCRPNWWKVSIKIQVALNQARKSVNKAGDENIWKMMILTFSDLIIFLKLLFVYTIIVANWKIYNIFISQNLKCCYWNHSFS